MSAGRDAWPLRGRGALVTGVSRRAGIGYAVARRLVGYGADVFLQHHVAHDREQAWGADPGGVDAVVRGVRAAGNGSRVEAVAMDLAAAEAPERLVAIAAEALGRIDVLVCNHARSGGDGRLAEMTAERLDAHWAVNARASILLAKAFARRHDGREGGRVVFMTSGQDQGPMADEIAYAASKGALASIVRSLSADLIDRNITVNAVNPGPVDTGYAGPELHEAVRRRFPRGRWGAPDDAANLIAWLATDEAAWITGQVISSEGGFRR